jgi:hypothetical protein
MNIIIESDCFIIVKVPDGEWSLIEAKAGTHLATIHPYEQFSDKESADEEMRKKYPDWGLEEEIEEIENAVEENENAVIE